MKTKFQLKKLLHQKRNLQPKELLLTKVLSSTTLVLALMVLTFLFLLTR